VTVTVLPVPTATTTAIPGVMTGAIRISSDLTGYQTFFLRDSSCAPLDSWTGDATYHDFSGLADGTYRGQVEKDTCLSACSSPVTLTNRSPDFDDDNDVDQEDFGHFQECLTGSGAAQSDPDCQDAKLDGDGDVDADDFDLFQNCMAGPNIPPAC
jgi:hypothetical protein